MQAITSKAQSIIDGSGDEDSDCSSERFKRAILVHAQASKLCAEILESNKQNK